MAIPDRPQKIRKDFLCKRALLILTDFCENHVCRMPGPNVKQRQDGPYPGPSSGGEKNARGAPQGHFWQGAQNGPTALHRPPETRSCASGCDPCPARIGVKTQFPGRATWTGIAEAASARTCQRRAGVSMGENGAARPRARWGAKYGESTAWKPYFSLGSPRVTATPRPRAATPHRKRNTCPPLAHVPSPCPFSRQGSDLSAVDLPGNWEVPGATSAKNHRKFSQKSAQRLLVHIVLLVPFWIIV